MTDTLKKTASAQSSDRQTGDKLLAIGTTAAVLGAGLTGWADANAAEVVTDIADVTSNGTSVDIDINGDGTDDVRLYGGATFQYNAGPVYAGTGKANGYGYTSYSAYGNGSLTGNFVRGLNGARIASFEESGEGTRRLESYVGYGDVTPIFVGADFADPNIARNYPGPGGIGTVGDPYPYFQDGLVSLGHSATFQAYRNYYSGGYQYSAYGKTQEFDQTGYQADVGDGIVGWPDNASGYIGVYFEDANTGEFHFGWVALQEGSITATLTGFNNVPGTPSVILPDDTGNNNGTAPEPGTLALLATGALGIAAMRRRKSKSKKS